MGLLGSRAVGLYRELSSEEELIFESKSVAAVVLVKEAFIKKVLGRTERREIPISYSMTNVYMTSKRLIFLILYQVTSQVLKEQGERSPELAGVMGTWFEIPLNAISDYQLRPLMLKEKAWEKDMKILEIWGLAEKGSLKKQSLMEIIYDEKRALGRSKDYMEALMHRGTFSKLFGKVESVSDKIFILGTEAATLAPSLKGFVSIKETQASNTEEHIFCSKCGIKQVPNPDTRFCSKCGAPLVMSEETG